MPHSDPPFNGLIACSIFTLEFHLKLGRRFTPWELSDMTWAHVSSLFSPCAFSRLYFLKGSAFPPFHQRLFEARRIQSISQAANPISGSDREGPSMCLVHYQAGGWPLTFHKTTRYQRLRHVFIPSILELPVCGFLDVAS